MKENIKENKNPKYKYKKISVYLYFFISVITYFIRDVYVQANQIINKFESIIIFLTLLLAISTILLIVGIVNIRKIK